MLRFFLVLAAAATALAAADLSGAWTGTMEANGSRVPVYLHLSALDGKLSGSMAAGNSLTPLQKVALDQDTLTFEARDSAGRTAAVRLSLVADLLIGESRIGDEVSKVRLSRPRLPDGRSAPPALLYKTAPEYTSEARAAKLQGTVLLDVQIAPSGIISTVKVRRGLGMGLDEKAVETVRHWIFRPRIENGEPVATTATIEVNFRPL